jgi:hypothetical protein
LNRAGLFLMRGRKPRRKTGRQLDGLTDSSWFGTLMS